MKIWSMGLASLVVAVGAVVACGNAEPGSGASGGGGNPPGGSTGRDGGEGGAGTDNPGRVAGAGGETSAGSGNAEVGGASGEGGAGAAAAAEPLLPWAVGNSWTYRVTKSGTVTEKTTTIGPREVVGGTGSSAELEANHVTTSKGAESNDHTESWQAPDPSNPDRILRFRELTYDPRTGALEDEVYCDPPKLHIDGSRDRTVKGATWLEKYTEHTLTVGMPETSHAVSERWTVVDDGETLEVPAGTFDHVVHFQKVGAATSKDYWYARGVGKLKETGTQTEELTAYSLR